MVSQRGSGAAVAHHLAKVRVAGSNPVFRSKKVLVRAMPTVSWMAPFDCQFGLPKPRRLTAATAFPSGFVACPPARGLCRCWLQGQSAGESVPRGLTTVDVQDNSRDERGLLEIEDSLDNVANLANSAQRMELC